MTPVPFAKVRGFGLRASVLVVMVTVAGALLVTPSLTISCAT